MTGRKGVLKPDQTTMCVKCNERLPPPGESVCSTCLIFERRGIPVPHQPVIPGQTPPPPRTPGYDKKPPMPVAAPETPQAPADEKPKT